MLNFKKIHIGSLISQQVTESGTELSRICNLMNCTEEVVEKILLLEDIPTNILLKWSKSLECDFFRIYLQHLILYTPPSISIRRDKRKTTMPHFRKNIYLKEVIDFLLEQIAKKMTKNKVIERYRISKTTPCRWISKFRNSSI